MTRNQRSAKRVRMMWNVIPFAGGTAQPSIAKAPVVADSDITEPSEIVKHPLLGSVAAR